MGFNSMACLQSASAAGMNSAPIMPSVTSISSPLSTSATYPAAPTASSAAAHSAAAHYPTMYKDSSYPGMSSSIASLRLKAKQHQSGFTSYSPQPPPLSPRSSSLSACQYTGGVPDRTLL